MKNRTEISRRSVASVLLHGIQDPGINILQELTQAGIGNILLHDSTPVSETDTAQHFSHFHIGRRKDQAAASIFNQPSSQTTVWAMSEALDQTRTDISIVIIDAATHTKPDANNVRHNKSGFTAVAIRTSAVLPVQLSGHSVQVGPFLRAQDAPPLSEANPSPCASCFFDSARMPLGQAPQESTESVGPGTLLAEKNHTPEALLHRWVAAIVSYQVLALIKGDQQPLSAHHGIVCNFQTGMMELIRVERSADCLCSAWF